VFLDLLRSTPPFLAPAAAIEFRITDLFPRQSYRVMASKADNGEDDKDVVTAEVREEGGWGRDHGFDAAFAMGIMIVLDRITSDEVNGNLGKDFVEPTSPAWSSLVLGLV
jgi:hypothetical protein